MERQRNGELERHKEMERPADGQEERCENGKTGKGETER
jgi:hypothetical protein